MRRALTKLLREGHRSIEKRSCKQRDSNERPNYQNVSFSLSSAASFFEWSQMVDVSLLESFPFLTSFYGNGGTKFPKTGWTAIVHNFVIDLGSGESGSPNSSGARQTYDVAHTPANHANRRTTPKD